MENKQIKPNTTPKPPSRSLWTLSYRLHGVAIALGIAAAFCYFYLHYWHVKLLIASIIFGYFLGWVIGHWTYKAD